MQKSRFAVVAATVAALPLLTTVPAHAASLDIPGLIGEGVDNLEYTVASGVGDTVSSLGRFAEAHAYLAGDPSTRYVVVLGARLDPGGTRPAVLDARLDTAAAIARIHPANKVIVSGGPTQPLPFSEAQSMLVGLVLRGVNPANIILENASYSTVENARNTTGILASAGAQGAVLVTSASHIDRALATFQAASGQFRYVPVAAPG
ncbi:YdcF family protein [Rhodococcus sp. SGAir0479]|uniref:YdcF family protein n=1 Tax=Rhodococcus sp. SGAir0479 TaxID=2567884 RepID=UPI0010CCB877|nr:YdcF family protein [Rhodococcus sp. SGAir0479]QCQ91440.1 YdcF family protein [Rhodococcus sp. SGAir0479]